MDSELEHFKSSFVRQCKELMIEPAKSILDRISVSNISPRNWGRYTLNLSSITLSSKCCEVLSKLLVHDSTFSEINLNNCSITEAGLRALCLGLTDNLTCRKLSLMGNSIRGEGASCLGRMIRNNLKLHSLCLDQNSIGLLEKDFIVFCEGLGGNRSMHVLDLQNNQVTPQGTQALCEALKLNYTLKCIDLRFNHVGMIGGRAIISMLKRNKTISMLLLDGNDIPRDVLSAIEATVAKNAISSCATTGHCTTDCGHDIRQAFHKTSDNFNFLGDGSHKSSPSRTAFDRLNNLSEILEERKRHVRDVSMELAHRSDDLIITEERLKDANTMMKFMRVEHDDEVKRLKEEFDRDKQEHQLTERRLVKEITELSEKKFVLENKMSEQELKSQLKDDKINQLNVICTQLESKIKINQAQYDESLSQEKQKFKVTLKDMEVLNNKELEVHRKDRENVERIWKEEKKRLESECYKMEMTLKDLGSQVERSKVNQEQEMEKLRVAMKTEEAQRRSSYEDRLHEIERSRDDVQMTLTKVQGERTRLITELEQTKQLLSQVQQDLVSKQREKQDEILKTRSEAVNQIRELELEVKFRDGKLKDAQQDMQMLRGRIKCLKEMDLQHSTTLQLVAQNLVAREVMAAVTS